MSLVGHEEKPLLAAIERLMNRAVEKRIVPGFEPGTAPSRPREPERRPRQGQPRRDQPRRDASRREQPRQPRNAQPRREARGAQGPHRAGRPGGGQRGIPYPNDEYQAQLQEARRRAREEPREEHEQAPRQAEPQAPREPRRPVVTHKKQRAVLLGAPRREDNG